MSTPENESNEVQPKATEPPQEPAVSRAIAPAWHTVVLVASIVALSIHGASRFSVGQAQINRLHTYGFTAALEVGMFAWVALGLRLKKIPLRSLLGSFSLSFRSIALDLSTAALFWIGSLMVLGSLGIAWSGIEAALTHPKPANDATQQNGKSPPLRQTGQADQSGEAAQTGGLFAADPARLKTLRVLAELAPANGTEIAAWIFLCLIVGFVEEVVFRGYLQRQFIGWAHGRVIVGALLSAVVFGGAHAYQGVRGMALLTVFGALFGLLALSRRSLRAGMFAHGWHDLIAGLALALLRSKHVI